MTQPRSRSPLPLPVLPYCLLAPHTARYDRQRMACVSTDYFAAWASAVRDDQLEYMQTLVDQQPSSNRLLIANGRVSFRLQPGTSFRFAGVSGLTVLGERLAEILRHKTICLQMTSAEDVVTFPVIELLRRIRAPLTLKLFDPSALMLSTLLRMDICSHLEIEGMPTTCTPLLLHHVACTTNLRVLSLGYMPDGIPEPLRSACSQNTSLCYAGAYAPVRPFIRSNGLIPHPFCWAPQVFTTSIINDCPADALERICEHLQEIYPGVHWEHRTLWMTMYASALLCCTPKDQASMFVRQRQAKTTAFHGTSLANAMSIKQSMTLTENAYVTPEPYYALHPAYAVPYFVDEGKAIQALIEVDTASHTFTKSPSTMEFCPLPGRETIEWTCPDSLSVVAIYLLVYTRGD